MALVQLAMDSIAGSEWPKWYNKTCDKCGEYVPAGNAHYCDSAFAPKGETDAKRD